MLNGFINGIGALFKNEEHYKYDEDFYIDKYEMDGKNFLKMGNII